MCVKAKITNEPNNAQKINFIYWCCIEPTEGVSGDFVGGNNQSV
jgi:hypothetical protein